MPNKIENALRFYILATQLKYKIRTGWDDRHWNISKERRESIAEHIYGACILAIALDSEFETNLDIQKVITMLVLHELGEIVIGDITPFDGISNEEKLEKEYEAISKVLGDLQKKAKYFDLLVEFNEGKTKEAIFAYYCDKAEAEIQAKIYQDMGHQHPLTDQKNNIILKNPLVQEMLKNGAKQPFDIFHEWNKPVYKGDETFSQLLEYIKDVDTRKFITKSND